MQKIQTFFARRKLQKIENKIARLEQEKTILQIKFPQLTANELIEQVQTTKTDIKEKVTQQAFRYFLKVDANKGVMSAQIKKIAGSKAIWERATTGRKNLYVKGIEGKPSNTVDEVMNQIPNLEKFFNKSPFVAKYWRAQK